MNFLNMLREKLLNFIPTIGPLINTGIDTVTNFFSKKSDSSNSTTSAAVDLLKTQVKNNSSEEVGTDEQEFETSHHFQE